MDKNNLRRAILSQMYVMKAQMESLIFMIEELERDEDDSCPHPKEQRLNLTTMGGPEHWQCKLCGFEYKEEKLERK